MEKLFGLPAHPLLVHAPVALSPLVAVFCGFVLFKPAWRARLGWWAVGATGVLAVMYFLARESGEALEEAIETGAVKRHAELADWAFRFSVLTFVLVLATVVMSRRSVRVPTVSAVPGEPAIAMTGGATATTPAVRALSALSLVLAVLTVVWTIRTGHEGAKVVWDGVLK